MEQGSRTQHHAQLCDQIRAGQMLELRPPHWCNFLSGNATACSSAFVRESALTAEVWECSPDNRTAKCHTRDHFACEMPPPPPAAPAPSSPPCSPHGHSCARTGCCTRPSDGCLRRAGTDHLGDDMLCRPADGCRAGRVLNGWHCPGWESCAPPYGNCILSGCCEQPEGSAHVRFDCFKRPALFYAQCRPTPLEAPRCVDSDEWLCPGWPACAEPFDDCSASRCCIDRDGEDFGCFKRPYSDEAQCRPYAAGCEDSDGWLCPGWDRCSSSGHDCTKSRCCNQRGFTCYLDDKGAGLCMLNGTCEAQRQGGASACLAVDESTPYPPPPAPMSPSFSQLARLYAGLPASVTLLAVACALIALVGLLACLALWRQMRRQGKLITSTMMSEEFAAAEARPAASSAPHDDRGIMLQTAT